MHRQPVPGITRTKLLDATQTSQTPIPRTRLYLLDPTTFVLKNKTQAATIEHATIVVIYHETSALRCPPAPIITTIAIPTPTPNPPTSRTTSETHNLRLPPTLHERLLPAIPGDGLDVIGKAVRQTRQSQEPEDEAEGQRDALLDGCRSRLEVEGDDDGDGDDGEVDA